MSDDLTPEAVRRFIDQYESGEQGCHMEADQAQSFAATLRALSERLAEVEAERDALKAYVENDADWKFSAKRRLELFREQRERADAAEAALATARADALREAADEELIRELVRRNGITNGPKSRTPHEYEVLLGIGSGNHCYLTFTDKSDVDALIPKGQTNDH